MREIRTYGSEGGEARKGLPYPYPALRAFVTVPGGGEKTTPRFYPAKILRNS